MTGQSPFPPPPSQEVVTGDRIATDLLRTAVDRDKTLVTRHGLPICLRAALLAELALDGAIGDTGRAPLATGDAPVGDPILAAVHRTVSARPKVAWKRWYRHVEVDLTALSDELVGRGTWTDLGGRLGRKSFLDREADVALEVALRARAVGLGEEPPESAREAVLGVLVVSCGGVAGPARPKAAIGLHEVLPRFDDLGGQRLQAAHVAVGTAQLMLRRLKRRLR